MIDRRSDIMTEIEMQVYDLLGAAMMKHWNDGPDVDRSKWWFIQHVRGYWLDRCNEERIQP